MGKVRENHYTLSMLMNEDQVLVAYKTDHSKPVIFDRTGGYGQQGIPMVMAWIQDERTWLIGQEASELSDGDGFIINDLCDGVIAKEKLLINGEPMAYTKVVALFLSKIASEIREINPYAILEKIIIKMPQCFTTTTAQTISDTLQNLLGVSILLKGDVDGGVAWVDSFGGSTKNLWVDYDREGFHAYTIIGKQKPVIEKVLSLKSLGLSSLEKEMQSVISQAYKEHLGVKTLKELDGHMIQKMVKTYLPQLFNKESQGQPLKLTFNHVFPPFQSVISHEQLASITQKYYKGVEQGLNYLKHTFVNYKWTFTGEGLRMPWLKKVAQSYVSLPSDIQWEGKLYGLLKENVGDFTLNKASYGDIGLLICKDENQNFYPLIPWKEALLGFENQVELIIEDNQDFITLVRALEDQYYEIIEEQSITKYLNDAINHIVLKVSCDGHMNVSMNISKLTL